MCRSLKFLVAIIAAGLVVLALISVRRLSSSTSIAQLNPQSKDGTALDTPGPKTKVPDFQIQISLSKEAAAKLSTSGEWIEGHITFDGDGRKKDGEDTGGGRDVYLGDYEFETNCGGTISVTNAAISEEAFGRLTNSDYFFTVNVFSARRVFTNNILDGGYAGGRISEAAKSPIAIDCTLLQYP